MRKHFLILMLMALLPLAGWAEPTAYTDVTVTVGALSKTNYNGSAEASLPVVTVTGKVGAADPDVIDPSNYNLVWKNPSGVAFTTAAGILNAGTYTVEVQAKNEGDTFTPATGQSLTKSFSLGKHVDPVVVRATSTSITYGDAAPALNLLYTITESPGRFTTDGGVAALGAPVDMPTFADLNAGNKPFTLVARSYVNYNVVVEIPTGSLTVAKKSITITTADITGEFTYGDAKPTGLTVENYAAQLVPGDALTGTLAFDFKKYVADPEPTETLIEGDLLPAGTYHVYPKGLSNDNYAITWAYDEFVVGRKVLTSAMITAMEAKTYNAAKQVPTLALTDGTLPAPEVDVDYTAAWVYSTDNGESWGAAPAGENAFKPAGLYKVTLSGVATGNYKTPAGAPEEPAATATYTINKKALYIKTKNQEKTYNSQTAYVPASNADHLTFVGLEGEDAAVYTGLVVSLGDVDGKRTGIDAGQYPINVTGTLAAALATNYTAQFGSLGKLTIKKKAITLKANNDQKNYGEVDSYVAGITATNVISNPEDANYNKAKYVKQIGELATGDAITTKPTLKRNSGETASSATNIYTITPSAVVIKYNGGTPDDADDDVITTDNYEITWETATFTIVAGGFTIWADDKSSVFGSETLQTLTATVDGIPDVDAKKIVFNEGYITTEATAASTRGVYTITIDKTKIDFSAIEDLYDISKVVVVPGNYTITPKALKIKAKDQAHILDDAVTAASLENIEFVTEGVSDDDKDDVIAGITLTFNGANGLTTYLSGTPKTLQDGAQSHGWNGSVATTDGIWVGAIAIDATVYNGLPNANYTLNAEVAEGAEAKAGTLYVTAAGTALPLNRNTAAASADLQLADINAKAGKIVDVTFTDDATGHKFSAEKWNTLVLPFDITVTELSRKLGYAIVNTLNTTATKYNEVHFTLTMGKIPANTPFIFKTATDETINGKTFTGVQIVKPKVATDDNKVGVAADGCTFYGTYGRTFLRKANDKTWINDKLVTGKTETAEETGATFLYPYAAFLSLDDPEARIFIEDINEDGTTAIKTLNVETMKAYAVDGWYTLNGVKLQSVPTEKGVYINNGKKVVIK